MNVLDRLDQLERDATPLPWRWEFSEQVMGEARMTGTEHEDELATIHRTAMGASSTAEIDAELIALSRAHLRALLDVARAAQTHHGGDSHNPDCAYCAALAPLLEDTE